MNTTAKKLDTDKNHNSSTTKTLVSAVHDAIDEATEKAEPVVKSVRKKAAKAQDRLIETTAEASENIHEQVVKVGALIKQRPIAAAGIAAVAAGVLAAIFLRRR